MLKTQNNPGGRWSGGGTGGGTEGQVHVEVTRPGTEATPAEQGAKAAQTGHIQVILQSLPYYAYMIFYLCRS